MTNATPYFPSPIDSKFAGPGWKEHFAPIGTEYTISLRSEEPVKEAKPEIQKVAKPRAGKQSHRW